MKIIESWKKALNTGYSNKNPAAAIEKRISSLN